MKVLDLLRPSCSCCAEEHKARLKAEAEAEHATRRLTVAQEQMAEYAQQRESEAGSLLGEVQALQAALSGALQQQNGDSSAGLAAATAQIKVEAKPCWPLSFHHSCCMTGLQRVARMLLPPRQRPHHANA